MSSKDPDRDITRLFQEQRRSDEASAPSYRQVRARPRRRGAPVTGRMGRPAFAAAALLAVAAAVALFLRPSAPSSSPLSSLTSATPVFGPATSAASLASWKSPTEFFLQTPGAELLSRAPVLISPTLVSPPLEITVPASPSERG